MKDVSLQVTSKIGKDLLKEALKERQEQQKKRVIKDY